MRAMHGDRPLRLACARSNRDPFVARSSLVSLCQVAVDGPDLQTQLSAGECTGAIFWACTMNSDVCDKRSANSVRPTP